MKRLLFLSILLANIFSAQAQKLDYETLDGSSKTITIYQRDVDGLSCIISGKKCEISFPETIFKIAFYNQLATDAFYVKTGGREILYLTDSINLAKVKGITRHELSDSIAFVTLHLKPRDSAVTRLIEHGKVISTVKRASIDLYCRNNQDIGGLVSSLYRICFKMQIAHGLITKEEAAAQNHDWGTGPESFIKKYPNSIYNMEAEQIIERRAKQKANAR
ncbi:hypothetical protein [Paraflavitalea pollutisoli]|uniref:hypothetical protein n=1 Tax=Paraflavitalea pollutisoli TaxID=3034143 RepID=UPI0023EAB798|nr:hypothetical protein [Paraflavitalea sp. H1-2-19X]